MTRSDLIAQIILKNGIARTLPEARQMFMESYSEHHSDLDLIAWDRQVSETSIQILIEAIEENKKDLNIKFLIKDIDTILNHLAK